MHLDLLEVVRMNCDVRRDRRTADAPIYFSASNSQMDEEAHGSRGGCIVLHHVAAVSRLEGLDPPVGLSLYAGFEPTTSPWWWIPHPKVFHQLNLMLIPME